MEVGGKGGREEKRKGGEKKRSPAWASPQCVEERGVTRAEASRNVGLWRDGVWFSDGGSDVGESCGGVWCLWRVVVVCGVVCVVVRANVDPGRRWANRGRKGTINRDLQTERAPFHFKGTGEKSLIQMPSCCNCNHSDCSSPVGPSVCLSVCPPAASASRRCRCRRLPALGSLCEPSRRHSHPRSGATDLSGRIR